MKSALGVESIDNVVAFRDLAVVFFSFWSEASGCADDRVCVIEGELLVWFGLDPEFKLFFGFERADIKRVE